MAEEHLVERERDGARSKVGVRKKWGEEERGREREREEMTEVARWFMDLTSFIQHKPFSFCLGLKTKNITFFSFPSMKISFAETTNGIYYAQSRRPFQKKILTLSNLSL